MEIEAIPGWVLTLARAEKIPRFPDLNRKPGGLSFRCRTRTKGRFLSRNNAPL